MAKPLKEAGLRELEIFQRRVRRQHSLGRIADLDFESLERKVSELIKKVNDIMEVDSDGNLI